MVANESQAMKCHECGVRFARPATRGPAPKYCSSRCRHQAFLQRKMLDDTRNLLEGLNMPNTTSTISDSTTNFSPTVKMILDSIATKGAVHLTMKTALDGVGLTQVTALSKAFDAVNLGGVTAAQAAFGASGPSGFVEQVQKLIAAQAAFVANAPPNFVDKSKNAVTSLPEPTVEYGDPVRLRATDLAEDWNSIVAAPDPMTTVIGLLGEILAELRKGQ